MKAAYKPTKVGVLPDDWDTPLLGEIIASTQLGGNYRNSERESNWPLIKMGNLGRGSIKLDKLEFIDPSQPPATRDRLQTDDILFNTRNTLELVGKVSLWRDELPEAYFNSNIMRLTFDRTRVASSPFMSYLLNTRQSVHSLRGIAAGTTSVAAIYERDLARIVVPLPPKAEQVAIAEALSGTQALVSSLERLIAKKRLLKQGVAHQLLTGKTRLPGFTREWTLVSIDDVADRAAGVWGAGEPSPRNPRPADIIRAGDISQDSRLAGSARRYLTRQEFAKAECRLDDVVITTSGNGLGKVWWCDGREDLAASNFVRLLHPRPGRSQGRYLAYVLRSEEGLRQLQEHTATSAYPNLRPTFFGARWISLPPPDEQNAIAVILSNIDAEIATLQAKLVKSHQIRQGMAQQLLTGRIRLV